MFIMKITEIRTPSSAAFSKAEGSQVIQSFLMGKSLISSVIPDNSSVSFSVLVFLHLTDYRTDDQSCTAVFNMWVVPQINRGLMLFSVLFFIVFLTVF